MGRPLSVISSVARNLEPGVRIARLSRSLKVDGYEILVPSRLCRIKIVNTPCGSLADAAAIFERNIRHLVNFGNGFRNRLLSLFHLYPQFRPRGIDVRLLHRLA